MEENTFRIEILNKNDYDNIISQAEYCISTIKQLIKLNNIFSYRLDLEPIEFLSLNMSKNSPFKFFSKTNRKYTSEEMLLVETVRDYLEGLEDGHIISMLDFDNIRTELQETYSKTKLYTELDKDLFLTLPNKDLHNILMFYNCPESRSWRNLEISIIITDINKKLIKIDRKKNYDISTPDLKLDDKNEIEKDLNINIKVEKPSYSKSSLWKVYYKSNKEEISCEILDYNFLEQFRNQESYGPYPKDTMEVEADIHIKNFLKKDKKGKTAIIKKDSKIQKIVVHKVIKINKFQKHHQIEMFN